MDYIVRLLVALLLGGVVFLIGGAKFYYDLINDPVGLWNSFPIWAWAVMGFIGWGSFTTARNEE